MAVFLSLFTFLLFWEIMSSQIETKTRQNKLLLDHIHFIVGLKIGLKILTFLHALITNVLHFEAFVLKGFISDHFWLPL